MCPAGYALHDETVCVPCKPGTYSEGGEWSSCLNCPSWTTSFDKATALGECFGKLYLIQMGAGGNSNKSCALPLVRFQFYLKECDNFILKVALLLNLTPSLTLLSTLIVNVTYGILSLSLNPQTYLRTEMSMDKDSISHQHGL